MFTYSAQFRAGAVALARLRRQRRRTPTGGFVDAMDAPRRDGRHRAAPGTAAIRGHTA
ncbi:hypothetical protein FHS43_001741 [Streptosporangium becharense]|uniref:Uncharacterized protein n=1 Tax=Streptosporangium becharense TaxID=1816182 RepID=A0A7W9IMU1_9ACTN|nr:hypothetical protein [Streptosporangium becharense]MBB2910478.1 hypothetical protein [Streptosporangium becharense]MBB5823221.1 hypothetical protein [Streptosporangium becharense]